MLSELKQYAEEHNLVARAGFAKKSVKGYIHLSAKGDFLGIHTCEKGTSAYAPDIGSAANGTRYCNFLIEKAKIPLCMVEDEVKDKNIPTKHAFYISMLNSCADLEPKFGILSCSLTNDETRKAIVDGLRQSKLKGGDPIGFVVDGAALEKSKAYLGWWSEFRMQFAPKGSGDLSRCLISGQLTTPLATVPKVKGLMRVGGHSSGDTFLCFDKDAFQSYGLKQSANAAVSEEAITAVNTALTELIDKAPVFGGAKLVHWYSGEIPEDADIFGDMLEGEWEEEPDDQTEQDKAELERNAMQAAKKLLDSIEEGSNPERLYARYYIMPLSGAGGRMMVRGWHEGSFEELYQNIDSWFADLRIISPNGRNVSIPPKLDELSIRLLSPDGNMKQVVANPRRYDEKWKGTKKRINKELANLSGRLLNSIIHNHPLPDEVAERALRYIRSAMLEPPAEGQRESAIDKETLAFQLLKAWLVRRQRQRGDTVMIGESVSTSPKTTAYCCGQLMAVYSAIQSEAMPEVNVGVAERYYAAASTTPAFVIGKLSQLSQHHLPKLKAKDFTFYQETLDGIYTDIGERKIPTTLNMEQQTEFALGYYQQRAALPSDNKKEETEEGEQ